MKILAAVLACWVWIVPPVASSASDAVIHASSAGAHLDTDLMNGGGTDDTTALQTVLDRAANGRPIRLVIDGPALVRGLNVYGNTTVECIPGGGLYLKDQSDRAILRNVHRSRSEITDQNITIRGCFLNGNRFNQLRQAPGQNKNQEPDGTWMTGIQFAGARNVWLEQLTLWNIRAMGILIANAEHLRIRDIRVDNGSPPFDPSLSADEQLRLYRRYENTDGIDLYGPIQDAIMDGLAARSGDDALSLNTGDGTTGPYVGQGPIMDVIATNIVLEDANYGIRLLSSTQRLDRVIIKNVTGTVQNRVLLLSPYIERKLTGNIGSILVSDVNVKPLRIPPPREYFASLKASEEGMAWIEQENYPLFSLNASIENLTMRHVLIDASEDQRPVIQVGPQATVQTLDIDLQIRDPQLRTVPLRLEPGARIDRLHWGLDWRGREVDIGKSPILNRGGTLRQLHWVSTPPRYVQAQRNSDSAEHITVTFSQVVKSTDFKDGVAVHVNGALARIMEATRDASGEVIRYRIAAPMRREDSVTWAYDEARGTIQNTAGDPLLSVEAKTVSIN